MKKAKRKGNPTLGLVMLPKERDLVDAYREARGLSTRSQALRELVLWALGDNDFGVSAITEKLPKRSSLLRMSEQVLASE